MHKKFEVGSTYSTRSVCDSECFITVTILKRTNSTITTTDGKTYRVKVSPYYNAETFMPWGRYSMAPIMTAEKIVV